MPRVLQFDTNMFHLCTTIPNCTSTEPTTHRTEESNPGPFLTQKGMDQAFLIHIRIIKCARRSEIKPELTLLVRFNNESHLKPCS